MCQAGCCSCIYQVQSRSAHLLIIISRQGWKLQSLPSLIAFIFKLTQVPLDSGTSDEVYLSELDVALHTAAKKFPDPHLVVYNAGTDILIGDPLGKFEVSPAAVQQRDAAVFAFADKMKAPIVVLLSGGYSRASAGVIVDSLTSLLMGMAAKLQATAPAGARTAQASKLSKA